VWLKDAGALIAEAEVSAMDKVLSLLSAPYVFCMGYTIPPLADPKHRKLYPIAFLMSIVWIAFLCLWMVLWAG
jgi:hypothetical protein